MIKEYEVRNNYYNMVKKIKKIRFHREGFNTLLYGGIAILLLSIIIWKISSNNALLGCFFITAIVIYGIVVNFFRCPIRLFEGETDNVVVAPADGRIVVVEEVEEDCYFHEKRLMVSIFMSLFNVHANWFPVDGTVEKVYHQNGNFHKAWLPKASEENEHADILIKTVNGVEILTRQIAGAVARRIVTYANEGDNCYIDEHLGFIKFGSRVDVFLPLETEILVKMGQSTTGNQTIIARLKP